MKKFLILITLIFTLTSLFATVASAEGGEALTPTVEESFFDGVYDFLSDNADKIFSALAFVSSITLALLYRRGLLPLLRGGLTSLAGTVKTLKEETEKAEVSSRDLIMSAASKLEYTENIISDLSEKLSKIEEELSVAGEAEKRADDLRVLIGTQVDLLHDVFMASSLPYYRKEEVGERVAEMKKLLYSTEASSDE